MNAQDTRGELSQAELDMLVEGELPLAERQRIVEAIAQSPDGWRRCALAFMEAQAWRSSMRSLLAVPAEEGARASRAGLATTLDSLSNKSVPSKNGHASRFSLVPQAEHLAADSPRKAAASASSPRDFRATLLSWSAAALALILAVGLGYATGFRQAPTDVAAISEQGTMPAGMPRDGSPGGFAEPTIADGGNGDDAALRLVGTVNFDGAERPLPVVSGPGLDEEWLRNQPPLLSDYERSLLAQRGWRLKEDRQIITVQLADGSKLAIPIDALEYQYVGNRVY